LAGFATRALGDTGQPTLAQELGGLAHVAVRVDERALAVHDAGARLVAQSFHVVRGNRHLGAPFTNVIGQPGFRRLPDCSFGRWVYSAGVGAGVAASSSGGAAAPAGAAAPLVPTAASAASSAGRNAASAAAFTSAATAASASASSRL